MDAMTVAELNELRTEILNITLDTLAAVDIAYLRDKSYLYALLDAHKEIKIGLRVLDGKISGYKRHAEP